MWMRRWDWRNTNAAGWDNPAHANAPCTCRSMAPVRGADDGLATCKRKSPIRSKGYLTGLVPCCTMLHWDAVSPSGSKLHLSIFQATLDVK